MTRSGYPEGYIGQHTLFERRKMTTPEAKQWRLHSGMQIIMPASDEKALHRELGGLPLPSKALALQALEHLHLLPQDYGRVNMFNSVTNKMHDIADRNQDNARGAEAAVFAEHFENQRIFFKNALSQQDELELIHSQNEVIDLAEYARFSTEKERTPPPLTSAVIEIKKHDRAEYEPSQDYVVVDDEYGIYGIFDGMGGEAGRPDVAARAAGEAIADILRTVEPPLSLDEMKRSMKLALEMGRGAVMDNSLGGATTALVAWYVELKGEEYWVLGNAGDCRSFTYNTISREIKAPTTNQGYGRFVDNAFFPGIQGRDGRMDEVIILPSARSERLMLCSDGITGDTQDEEISQYDFLYSFNKETPFESALAFVEHSSKNDDKSIIVIDRSNSL